ncbi:MAG: hypothetical protein IJG62_02545 [Synergistaceae bacterium]|nr:hypothetical protein [Synergistaceae bacterium]MBQ6740758.1 hypothetical protein [Synergistaceae bacterium]MBQ6909463.1 hypothetical protein [Synergistaceae bacterium]MBR0043805.1 hypothetical protein [Synergistaceae bacterium]MBR0220840.1 hypothetical protein [Synergistaceae bacterium]
MAEIKTRAKFGSNKHGTQSQATADKAPERDVKEQATSNNEVNDTGKPDAHTQLEVNNKTAHQSAQADLILPAKPETKSKRVVLLMKPSVYDKLKTKAYSQRRSINNVVNALCELYISQAE